ncbi:hypothetical protein DL240_12380 [Lujinxingia litoralis]|uniref:2'-5' RNA ligase n=1 Tax=Lujinxingia litoralis TaxID=2211119 RepID=A0A328C616_9DELT|nr:2'-5' RNA ligase family protein [Lujinxingia litoralis]RAL21647.1 hypothetical protein DL240_12380 [Lujinxingia litoralis]
MYAVAAQLSGELSARIATFWDHAEALIPDVIPRAVRVPHLSFQIVESEHPLALEALLHEPLSVARPAIRTSALGVFARPRQVLFLGVVRDPALDRYFQAINRRLNAAGYRLHPFYSAAYWTPHITLALGPFGPAALCELLQQGGLARLEGDWALGELCLLSPKRSTPAYLASSPPASRL